MYAKYVVWLQSCWQFYLYFKIIILNISCCILKQANLKISTILLFDLPTVKYYLNWIRVLNIFLPLSGKKKTIQSIQFGSRFVAREASQVGNARSLGHAESKRGPVNTKSGLVMDRRAKDSDGLLCVRACVCRAASSSSASAYPSTATDRPHTGLLCHLLQQFHCCYHFAHSSGFF